MQDRRKLQRRHLIFYLRVYESGSDALIGYLVDITTEGIMIMSEAPIPINKVHHLRMALAGKDEEERIFTFDAESVWCHNNINPDFYDTGFRLLDVTPAQFASIELIIQEVGFRD